MTKFNSLRKSKIDYSKLEYSIELQKNILFKSKEIKKIQQMKVILLKNKNYMQFKFRVIFLPTSEHIRNLWRQFGSDNWEQCCVLLASVGRARDASTYCPAQYSGLSTELFDSKCQ